MSNGKPVKIGVNNEVCPYCGLRDKTETRIRGLRLREFAEYHGNKPFRAFECYCCSGRWHHELSPSAAALAGKNGDA